MESTNQYEEQGAMYETEFQSEQKDDAEFFYNKEFVTKCNTIIVLLL